MPFKIIKTAIEYGFDKAYLLPLESGKEIICEIMPEAQSVLLLLKKHNPYKSFPKGIMEVQSHYPAYQNAYLLHKNLIEILNSMEVKAKSANILPLKNYAEKAGLIRLKNSLMYDSDYGSYFAVQAIAVDIESVDMPVAKGEDICGSCDLCIRACPMGAIKPEGGIDREKCIRNHVPVKEFIPENIRIAARRGYIGCGICQAVCPKNGHIQKAEPSQELCSALDIKRILEEVGGSCVKELKTLIGSNEARHGRMLATACMIAGNINDDEYVPMLEEILISNENALVRGYAAWALGKIGKSHSFLMDISGKETDIDAKKEIISAIDVK